jgi:SAM-dependent methyltransferase
MSQIGCFRDIFCFCDHSKKSCDHKSKVNAIGETQCSESTLGICWTPKVILQTCERADFSALRQGAQHMVETSEYWNAYYARKETPSIPSQFACFVLGEFRGHDDFIDIGCGDGRDSLFFAGHGKTVLGADGSIAAVEFCQSAASAQGLKNAQFSQLDLNDAGQCADFARAHAKAGAIVYARFFLHAIDGAAQSEFLRLAAGLAGADGRVCLEFRTPKDEHLTKVTSEHYRRYVDPIALAQEAAGFGLSCTYFVEGFGYAKYKTDDAHVARMIFARQ